MLINELPTMSKLHRRRPNIYLIDTCIRCKVYKEDSYHLVTYNSQFDDVLAKLLNVSDSITEILYRDREIKVRINKEIHELYSQTSSNNNTHKYLYQLVSMTLTTNHLSYIKNIFYSKY